MKITSQAYYNVCLRNCTREVCCQAQPNTQPQDIQWGGSYSHQPHRRFQLRELVPYGKVSADLGRLASVAVATINELALAFFSFISSFRCAQPG